MTKFYHNTDSYANEMRVKVEKESERLNKCLGAAEKQVRDIKLQIAQLQETCPHIFRTQNPRPTADDPATQTCQACGFTA